MSRGTLEILQSLFSEDPNNFGGTLLYLGLRSRRELAKEVEELKHASASLYRAFWTDVVVLLLMRKSHF
jgi:hypothetical protein